MMNLRKRMCITLLSGLVFSVFSGSVFAKAVGALESDQERKAACEYAIESGNQEVARANVGGIIENCTGTVKEETAPQQQPAAAPGSVTQ